MSNPTERDCVLAAEIFNGDSVNWYKQAVNVIMRTRSEERLRMCEKMQALLNELLDDGHCTPT